MSHFDSRLAEIKRKWTQAESTAPVPLPQERPVAGKLTTRQAARMAEMVLDGVASALWYAKRKDEAGMWDMYSKTRDYLNDCLKR